MNEGLIPARYAKALYKVACEQKNDADLYQMMKSLEQSFSQQPLLQSTLGNPYVSNEDKTNLLITAADVTKKGKVLFCDFIKLLSENKRMNMARSIAIAYIALYRKFNNIYDVKVVSAAPMGESEQKRLRDMVCRHLNGGTMEYSTSVNPDLIGGFTVSVGNERIDASISNELKQLRLNLISK